MKISFQKIHILSLLAILLPVLVFAQGEDIPHKFYGTVAFENGPAPDGLLVEAKVGVTAVGNSITANGKYGYNPSLLLAADPQDNNSGKTVSFYVAGINTGETAVFSNGDSTNLNLTVPGRIGNITKNEGEVIANEEFVVTPQSSTNIQLGTNLSITISSATNTNATIEKIEKKSSGNVAVFSGKNFLNAYDIKISGASLIISVTMKYDGTGIDEDTVKPYKFDGTSWVAIPYSQNKTAKTITFTISSGQTVYGIFGSILVQSPPPTGGTTGGGGGGGGATTPTTYKTGDVNKDTKVDKYDFSLLMANWGKTGTNASDLNNDSKVDKYDFAILMANWTI